MIKSLFLFNFFNFYLPIYLLGFHNLDYMGVIELMFIQMVFKQIAINLIEYW